MASLIPPSGDLGLGDGYHSAQVDVSVRLNTNESPFAPPDGWVEEVAAEVRSIAYHRYPDRAAEDLRRALAAEHGVDPALVFVANGSNEVLQTLLIAYGGPSRVALVFEPTYALHSHIARLTRTPVVTGERDSEFAVPAAELARLAADSDLTFLCSPNNPTGLTEDREQIEVALAATSGLVVVDEAYGQFAPWSALELCDGSRPLIVVRTFSKTWSMAGVRLGYLIGPAEVVGNLDKVVLPYHLDSLKQRAGILALRYREEMESRVKEIIAERDRMAAALAHMPLKVWPSQANFVLFRPEADGREVWQALVERSVLVRDCTSWPRLDGCLRVTVGNPAENDAFLDALKEILT